MLRHSDVSALNQSEWPVSFTWLKYFLENSSKLANMTIKMVHIQTKIKLKYKSKILAEPVLK